MIVEAGAPDTRAEVLISERFGALPGAGASFLPLLVIAARVVFGGGALTLNAARRPPGRPPNLRDPH